MGAQLIGARRQCGRGHGGRGIAPPAVLLLALILGIVFGGAAGSGARAADPAGADIVLAIDNSLSMKQSDPQDQRIDAARRLIDTLATFSDSVPIRVGGISFGTPAAIEAWRGDFPEREEQDKLPVLWIVGGLLAQMVLIKFVGFSIATGVLFAMTARGFGRVSLPIALVSGILISALVWLVFARLLQLSLPAGPPERLMIETVNLVSGRGVATGPAK